MYQIYFITLRVKCKFNTENYCNSDTITPKKSLKVHKFRIIRTDKLKKYIAVKNIA